MGCCAMDFFLLGGGSFKKGLHCQCGQFVSGVWCDGVCLLLHSYPHVCRSFFFHDGIGSREDL